MVFDCDGLFPTNYVKVSNRPYWTNITRVLAGHACQRARSCKPSEGFVQCRASPKKKKIGGPARPIKFTSYSCRVVLVGLVNGM